MVFVKPVFGVLCCADIQNVTVKAWLDPGYLTPPSERTQYLDLCCVGNETTVFNDKCGGEFHTLGSDEQGSN